MKHRSARTHRDHRQRVRHVLGRERRALERIERDIHFGTRTRADAFADIQHGRLVAFSPSPMTTTPWISSWLSCVRIASTAAWSAAFSLPRPIRRADANAAASLTRARPKDSILS